MATEFMAETPSRVLRRVQQLEDMELPSLPSIQHDLDYDTETASEADSSLDRSQTKQMADFEEDPVNTNSLKVVIETKKVRTGYAHTSSTSSILHPTALRIISS